MKVQYIEHNNGDYEMTMNTSNIYKNSRRSVCIDESIKNISRIFDVDYNELHKILEVWLNNALYNINWKNE